MKTFNAGHSIYTTIETIVAGNTWQITKVVGMYNAITVLKVTNNPYRTLGKPFASFTAAANHYKSAEMKTALLMAEIEFEAADKAARNAAIVAELDRLARNN